MTICDNCIHDTVCGEEGHQEAALKHCAYCKAVVLQTWIEDEKGFYCCPICTHMEGKRRKFCSQCGSQFML